MATQRRIGAEDSASRSALLDAAQDLMLQQGHAAVSSRKVAARAGLKPQLVHYYFRTMDDLFTAMFRRAADEGLRRQAEALASPQPLWALWAYSSDPTGTALSVQFTALAGQRPSIRAEIASYAEQFRANQVACLDKVHRENDPVTAMEASVLITAVSRFVSMEGGIGVTTGHDAVRALVERLITEVEGPRATTADESDR